MFAKTQTLTLFKKMYVIISIINWHFFQMNNWQKLKSIFH